MTPQALKSSTDLDTVRDNLLGRIVSRRPDKHNEEPARLIEEAANNGINDRQFGEIVMEAFKITLTADPKTAKKISEDFAIESSHVYHTARKALLNTQSDGGMRVVPSENNAWIIKLFGLTDSELGNAEGAALKAIERYKETGDYHRIGWIIRDFGLKIELDEAVHLYEEAGKKGQVDTQLLIAINCNLGHDLTLDAAAQVYKKYNVAGNERISEIVSKTIRERYCIPEDILQEVLSMSLRRKEPGRNSSQ